MSTLFHQVSRQSSISISSPAIHCSITPKHVPASRVQFSDNFSGDEGLEAG